MGLLPLDPLKPVEKIITTNELFFSSLDSIVNVYIIGFSFNVIDAPYIKEIINSFKENNQISYKITYHVENEREKLADCINSLKLDNFNYELIELSKFLMAD